MISIYKEKIESIPVLTLVDSKYEDQPLPVVTYFHGFTSAKEHNLPIAYLLAEKGFRVVLPDSKLHGEREQAIETKKMQMAFWDIILKNIEELESIKKELDQKGLILKNRFAVAGTSMGGMTTASALTVYPWIKSAAILMGSPKLTDFAKALIHSFKQHQELPVSDEEIDSLYKTLEKYDLSRQPQKLNKRPVLFWHGENDSVVPHDHSYSFYQVTADLYQDENAYQMISEPGRDHKVSRAAILKTVDWFNKYV